MPSSIDLSRLPRTVALERQQGRSVLRYVDQRFLPGELQEVVTADWREVVDAIKVLGVRAERRPLAWQEPQPAPCGRRTLRPAWRTSPRSSRSLQAPGPRR